MFWRLWEEYSVRERMKNFWNCNVSNLFSFLALYWFFFLHTGGKISYLSSREISGQSVLCNWEVLSFPVVAKREGVLYLDQPFLHLLLQIRPHFFQVGHFKSIFHPTAREHMCKWTPLCHFHSWIPSTVFYAPGWSPSWFLWPVPARPSSISSQSSIRPEILFQIPTYPDTVTHTCLHT